MSPRNTDQRLTYNIQYKYTLSSIETDVMTERNRELI